jgi:tetratricopeptide (TPR) repeat protein
MNLISSLNTLESSGLIRLIAAQPDLEYLFRHALVQDAAYGSLLKQDRKQLHRAVGEVLERIYSDQRDEFAATLAYHFERAEVREKAAGYATRAGDRARERCANAEAVSFYRAAILQVEQILKSADTEHDQWHEALARLLESLADVLELIGQHDEARSAYERVLAVPEQPGSPGRIRQARLNRKIGFVLTVMRQHDEAQRIWDRAETALHLPPLDSDTPADTGAWQEWIEIQVERIWSLYWQNLADSMAQLHAKALPVMLRFGTPAQRARLASVFTLMRLRRDRYMASNETLAAGEEALATATVAGDAGLLFDARFALGLIRFPRRELQEAEEQLRIALGLAERTGDAIRKSRCLAYLMIVARMRGHVAETRNYIPQVLSTAWAGRMVVYESAAKASLAWLAWREEDLNEVRLQGRESLELMKGAMAASPFRWTAAWPVIGAALAEENIAEAIEQGRAMLDPTQMRQPEAIESVLAAATSAWERNEVEVARSQLQRSLELAQEMSYL